MNRKLINKILEELKCEEPNLSYIRGILETVLETLPEEKNPIFMGSGGPVIVPYIPPHVSLQTTNGAISDGVESLELGAKAKVAGLQKAEIL